MQGLVGKFMSVAKSRGFHSAFRHSISLALKPFMPSPRDVIRQRRNEMSESINRQLNSTIAYGPFAGVSLEMPRYFKGIRAAILLGLYEKEVLESISGARNVKTFVEIGAGEGYYVVAVVATGIFEKSYAFEAEERKRSAIRENSKLNNVEDRVVVKGMAAPDFLSEIPQDDLSSCLFLVDIEGGEFSLLSDAVLEKQRTSVFIVEVHDFMFSDGQQKLDDLRVRAEKTHKVSLITSGPRDVIHIPELAGLPDYEKWLVCGEGRKQTQIWLRFDPKE
jgi:hypothetical protein